MVLHCPKCHSVLIATGEPVTEAYCLIEGCDTRLEQLTDDGTAAGAVLTAFLKRQATKDNKP